MNRIAMRAIGLAIGVLTAVGIPVRAEEGVSVEPLSKEWAPLATISGFHSLVNKKVGLVLRVLEADGSSSVAENPLSLFVVATNQGTSDLQEHVWRLPRGVALVKKVTASKCGLDIVADVDATDEEQRVVGQKATVIKACFIDAKGKLESRLRLSETGTTSGSGK